MATRSARSTWLGLAMLAVAACGIPPLPGSHVELEGWFVPKAAADPICISFRQYFADGRSGADGGIIFNLVSLPAGTSWDPERGLLDRSGTVLVDPTGWARVEGRVVNAREGCPGTGLEVEAIDSIAPLEERE